MQIQVHYQGLDSSNWLEQFITSRITKLDRYLTPASSVNVHLKFANRNYVTSISIHNPHHDYAFSGEGLNLYESFSQAIDKAGRAMGEQKRKVKDKIHRRFFSLKKDLVA